MKKIKFLLPFICILLLFSSCIVYSNSYRYSTSKRGYEDYEEYEKDISTDFGPILTSITFLGMGSRFILYPPPPNGTYDIHFQFININDRLKRKSERENSEYTDDIMRSMYIDECRIVLPSGKIIDLLEKKINIVYHYWESGKNTGIFYEKEENVKPQYIDGVKRLRINGIKNDDNRTSVYFFTKIPYIADKVTLEYTLTIEWENLGTVKKRSVLVFNKKFHMGIGFPTV